MFALYTRNRRRHDPGAQARPLTQVNRADERVAARARRR
jgi:hypothetical protein